MERYRRYHWDCVDELHRDLRRRKRLVRARVDNKRSKRRGQRLQRGTDYVDSGCVFGTLQVSVSGSSVSSANPQAWSWTPRTRSRSVSHLVLRWRDKHDTASRDFLIYERCSRNQMHGLAECDGHLILFRVFRGALLAPSRSVGIGKNPVSMPSSDTDATLRRNIQACLIGRV